MVKPNSFSLEGVLDAKFESLELDEVSYDDLCSATKRWLHEVELHLVKVSSESYLERQVHLDRVLRCFSNRRVSEFRQQMKPRTALETALVELFLLSRIRSYVLAYLSVQEGEAFEGATSYETDTPILIAQTLRSLGHESNCFLDLGVGWFRFHIDLDPLMHLRHLYSLVLQDNKRKGSLLSECAVLFHKSLFWLKSKLLGFVVRYGVRRFRQGASLGALQQMPNACRLIALQILLLFPSAKELTKEEWDELMNRLTTYFVPRISSLRATIPKDSVQNQGFIKLLKVAFGTIVGRCSVRQQHEADNLEFIFNTLRIAYSWGVTYPLVDNVLDSAATTADVRGQLTSMLHDLFSDEPCHTPPTDEAASVREVRERLTEVLALVPRDRLAPARRLLRHLLESHRRDSKRRLSEVGDEEELRANVWADTALKAALIRLATMEVCGIEVDRETLTRNIVRGLFNQLGDDLWDIYEDHDDNRVTPYTLYLTRGGPVNPFEFYLDYSLLLARGFSRRRQTAIFMGYCETLRDSLLALRKRNADPLHVAEAITKLLDSSSTSPQLAAIQDVPHVDFDAVLFAIESALMELLAGR